MFLFASNGTNKQTVKKISLLIMFSLSLLFPIFISAQSFSGVTGVVTDPTGAVVPGVTVTLLDTKTSKELTTKTNDQGVYIFNNIPPGAGYKLSFTAQGFQTLALNDVQLGVGKTQTQDAQLTTGQVTETVQITSSTGDATLNTTDSSVGNIIGSRQLKELPIQIRNSPAALIGLQPGAIGNNVGAGGGNRTGSVTGARADQGNITIDGLDANDQSTGQAFATVANAPIDSVQEFRAVTSSPSGSEGRSSGGQIQLTTNSGTNEFHGSVREYYRTEKTAANSFFNNRTGVARPKLQRNQYGGSIGGPLPFFNFGEGGPMFKSGKDKLFFFFDYEARNDAQEVTYSRIVPLQSLREGRLAYVNSTAGCTSASRQNTTPNCISFLTPGQIAAIDPLGVGVNQAFLNVINSRYPVANDLTLGDGINYGGYRFNAPTTRADDTYTTKINANITSNQTASARFTISRRNQTDTVNSVAKQFPDDVGGPLIIDRSYSYIFGHNWVITPNITNAASYGLSASVLDFPNTNNPSFPNTFVFGALSNPFADIDTQARVVKTPQFKDDLTWTAGSHTIQFGGIFKPINSNSSIVNDLNSVVIGGTTLTTALRPGNILTGNATTNTAVQGSFDGAFGLLLGRYSSISTNFVYDTSGKALAPGTGKTRNYKYNEYEFYAQDSWRIRNDLTINFGVRWHYYEPPYEKDGLQAGASVDYDELVAKRVANAAAGIAGPTAEPLTSYSLIGKANNGRPIYQPDKNNFAPRLSLVYAPSFENGVLGTIFGERKTSIRLGGALVYDRVGGGITFIQDQVSFIFDNTAATTFTGATAAARLANNPRFTSLNNLPLQNIAPAITRPYTPYVEGGIPIGLIDETQSFNIAENFQIPYAYNWNVGVQRELPGNFLLDVNYVGRLGRKLFAQADAAQVLDFKDPASGQFMLSAFNGVQAQLNAGVAAGNVTRQPWIENQLNAAIPGACVQSANPNLDFNCTAFLAVNFQDLLQTGRSADLVQAMYSNGFLRPNVGLSAQFASNPYITNLGYSNYHGMLVSLQKRFSKGFEFDLNYTWSHSIDNQSSVVNTVTGGYLCDIRDVNACRGNSDFDIRHLANFNGIWEVPFGRGRAIGGNMNKWADAVIGGWTFSGIVGARTGFAINPLSGSFGVNYFVSTPAILTGDASALKVRIHDEPGGIQFYDNPAAALAALRFPRHGESGSRNSFRSPGFWNLDMGLSKKFKMPWSETHKLTFRMDAFNVTNTNSFSVPNLSMRSTAFGRITASLSSPRELQFALRYDF